MAQTRDEKYVMLTIVIGFVSAFVLNVLSFVLYPPDVSGDFPVYNVNAVMIIQFAGACIIITLTVIAMKAELEMQILAAGGFTAQAISFGITVLSIFDIVDPTSFEQYERYSRITVSSSFLYFLSLILIASYDRFKNWVRLASIVAGIPFLVGSTMFLSGVRNYHLLENVNGVGVLMISITWLFWAFNIYSNYKRDHLS